MNRNFFQHQSYHIVPIIIVKGKLFCLLVSIYIHSLELLGIELSLLFAFYRLSLTLSCSMKLHKYPLDDQLCPINVESCKYFSVVFLSLLKSLDGFRKPVFGKYFAIVGMYVWAHTCMCLHFCRCYSV